MDAPSEALAPVGAASRSSSDLEAVFHELRRRTRRARYERLVAWVCGGPTPEDLLATSEDAARVRGVLATMSRRQAELLLLHSDGLRYEELAAVLRLKAASVGTLLSRAQRAFRKEYVRRHGET